MSQTRRLAAILAADVAGYSRLMGADEEGTLERLKALRALQFVDPRAHRSQFSREETVNSGELSLVVGDDGITECDCLRAAMSRSLPPMGLPICSSRVRIRP